jgi:hypothetical protein
MTTLSSLTVSYELSLDTTDHLGADALDVWTAALMTELEATFPGCEVDVTARWSSDDASRYSLTGETVDGYDIAGSKAHGGGVEVYDGAADADVPAATLRAIADGITPVSYTHLTLPTSP